MCEPMHINLCAVLSVYLQTSFFFVNKEMPLVKLFVMLNKTKIKQHMNLDIILLHYLTG